MRREFVIAVIASIGFEASPASATLIEYNDLASWSAAVSDIETATIPLPPIPPGSTDHFSDLGGPGSSVTYDGVTFTEGPGAFFYAVGYDLEGGLPVLSSEYGTPNILITLPEPVDALALYFGTANGSPVTFTLSNGDSTALASTGGDYGFNVPDFFGVTDDRLFTSVLVSATGLTLNLNQVSYGMAPGVIPELPTWTMIGLGFVSLAFTSSCARRRESSPKSSLARRQFWRLLTLPNRARSFRILRDA